MLTFSTVAMLMVKVGAIGFGGSVMSNRLSQRGSMTLARVILLSAHAVCGFVVFDLVDDYLYEIWEVLKP